MKDALKGYLALATGLTEVTRQRATAAARALVAQGEATAGQVGSLADDLVAQSRGNREAVAALVKFEVDRALGRVGLATADDVAALSGRIRTLETSLRQSATPAPTPSDTPSSTTRESVAGEPVAGGPARTSRTPASKTTAAVKKAPVKAAPVKKAAVKAAPVKKAAVKRAAVKPTARARTSGDGGA